MSTAKGIVTFIALAAASYYGATAMNGAGAPATTAASTTAPVVEAGAIDLVSGAGLGGGANTTLTGGSSLLTGGGGVTAGQSAASAWGVGGLEGALASGGSALNTFGDAASKGIIDTAKDYAIDQGKKTLVQEGGKSIWEQIDNSKLVNTGLNIAAGAIGSYAEQKAAQEAEEAKSKKIRDGAKSGLGLSLWGNTRRGT